MRNDDDMKILKLLCEIAPVLAKHGQKDDEAWAAYSKVINYIHLQEKIMLAHFQEGGTA